VVLTRGFTDVMNIRKTSCVVVVVVVVVVVTPLAGID